MTATLLEGPEASLPVAQLRRRWWLITSALILVAAGTISLVVALLPDRAHSFYAYDGINERWSSIPLGRTAVVGADIQPRDPPSGHHTIDLQWVLPRVAVNTAHATVHVVECRVADPHVGIGTEYPTLLRRQCATVRPFAPGPVDLGFPANEIVYEVTASAPGRVRIEGSEVTYTDGGRSGRQAAGTGIVLVFTAKH